MNHVLSNSSSVDYGRHEQAAVGGLGAAGTGTEPIVVPTAGPLPGGAQPSRAPAKMPGPGADYFRCTLLSATLSVRQCRLNRSRAPVLEFLRISDPRAVWQPSPCVDCALAERVEAGAVRFYSLEDALAGLPRAESDPRRSLPGEARESARPSNASAFTSGFWLPEWEF
jgi:hypothetical protein